MDAKSTLGIPPERVARLLAIGTEGPYPGPESADEASARLLRDRLAGPLPLEESVVDALPVVLGRFCREVLPMAGRPLGEILADSTASRDALELIKDYGKILSHRHRDTAQQSVAIAIYYAAIAAALVHHGHKITAHSYEKLATAFGRLIEKKWMEDDMARLFAQAKDICSGKGK